MQNAYLETLDRMEPDIAAVDLTAAAASLAISAKRQADALHEIRLALIWLVVLLSCVVPLWLGVAVFYFFPN